MEENLHPKDTAKQAQRSLRVCVCVCASRLIYCLGQLARGPGNRAVSTAVNGLRNVAGSLANAHQTTKKGTRNVPSDLQFLRIG